MATTNATTLAHTLGGISSDISTAEINRLDGVTGDLQTQLDAKLATATAASTYAPKASPEFTGTVSSSGSVGIGTTSTSSWSSAADDLVINIGAGNDGGITINSASSGTDNGAIYFAHGTSANAVGRIDYDHNNNSLAIFGNNTKRILLDQYGELRTQSARSGTYDNSCRLGGGSDPSTALSIANNNSCKLDGGTNGSFLILVYSGSAGQGAVYFSSFLTGTIKVAGHSDFTASSSSGSYRLTASGHTINMFNYGGSTQTFYFTIIGAFIS